MKEKEVGIVERISARGSIENLIAEADDLLSEQMDDLIELFRVVDQTFYDGYWIARSTRNLGIRHEHPETPQPEQTDKS
jgi:hypothetical protein